MALEKVWQTKPVVQLRWHQAAHSMHALEPQFAAIVTHLRQQTVALELWVDRETFRRTGTSNRSSGRVLQEGFRIENALPVLTAWLIVAWLERWLAHPWQLGSELNRR